MLLQKWWPVVLIGITCSFRLFAAAPMLQWPCLRPTVVYAAVGTPPFSYVDEHHQLNGYRIELVKELFQRLKCPLQLRADAPWKRSLMLLEHGVIDIMPNASKSAEREVYAWFSDASEAARIGLFVSTDRAKTVDVRQLSDLVTHRYKIGVIRGNFYGDKLNAILQQPSVKPYVIEANDKHVLYELLLKNRVDVYLDYFPNGNYALRDEHLESEIHMHSLPPFEIGRSHYMFSKKSVSVEFVRRFDLELAQMSKDGFIAQLRAKYALSD